MGASAEDATVSGCASSFNATRSHRDNPENESLTCRELAEMPEEGRESRTELPSQRHGFGLEDQEASSKSDAATLRCQGRTNPGKARVPPGRPGRCGTVRGASRPAHLCQTGYEPVFDLKGTRKVHQVDFREPRTKVSLT